MKMGPNTQNRRGFIFRALLLYRPRLFYEGLVVVRTKVEADEASCPSAAVKSLSSNTYPSDGIQNVLPHTHSLHSVPHRNFATFPLHRPVSAVDTLLSLFFFSFDQALRPPQ